MKRRIKQNSFSKKSFALLLIIFLVVGCSSNSNIQNETIKSIKKDKLNEIADSFANETFDYFSQLEIDYENFHVKKIEINHYKDGVVIDNFFRFMREEDDEELPDIQYVYLGYNLYPKQEFDETGQSITTNIYLYGPTQKNKYSEEYSMVVRNPNNFFTYNKANLKKLMKIEFDEKYYINPIIFNSETDYKQDESIKKLIDNGIELIVLEII